MPRVRHNDSGDPANDVCGNPRCRHVRAKHDGPCTGKRYDPFNNVGDSCRCKAFAEPKPKPVVPPGTVNLQASWRGEPPVPGDYLMSPVRPRFAFRIIEILKRKTNGRGDGDVSWYDISAERVGASTVPKTARVHGWKWNPRKSKTGGAFA
jgi:hypothetical protein